MAPSLAVQATSKTVLASSISVIKVQAVIPAQLLEILNWLCLKLHLGLQNAGDPEGLAGPDKVPLVGPQPVAANEHPCYFSF